MYNNENELSSEFLYDEMDGGSKSNNIKWKTYVILYVLEDY